MRAGPRASTAGLVSASIAMCGPAWRPLNAIARPVHDHCHGHRHGTAACNVVHLGERDHVVIKSLASNKQARGKQRKALVRPHSIWLGQYTRPRAWILTYTIPHWHKVTRPVVPCGPLGFCPPRPKLSHGNQGLPSHLGEVTPLPSLVHQREAVERTNDLAFARVDDALRAGTLACDCMEQDVHEGGLWKRPCLRSC